MGRNKGLIIALILLVVVAIALGITTYMFKKQADEGAVAKATAVAEAAKLNTALQDRENEIVVLKRLIGEDSNTNTPDIELSVTRQLAQVAPGVEKPDYKSVVATFLAEKAELSKQIAKLKVDVQSLDDKSKADADKYAAELAKLGEEMKKAMSGRDDWNEKMGSTLSDIEAKLEEQKQSVAVREKKAKDEAKKAAEQREAAIKVNEASGKKIATLETKLQESQLPPQENPMGKIRYVSPRGDLGTIDLGRADRLKRSITFSVYDPKDMSETGLKGTIQVIEVSGEREAEVRIFNDDEAFPIEVGDVIYTPTWSPGYQEHFAVAGFIDIDGDGTSDLDEVLALIKRNGGVIDAYQAEDGTQNGMLTENTAWLIVGRVPDDKSSKTYRDTYTNLDRKGKEFSTQRMQLHDLLRKMGYQPPATARDVSIRPDTGTIGRTSGSNVSGLYKDDGDSTKKRRTPPRSAY